MLSTYDYIVIAFYFVFMAGMGWVFKKFIKNTSDYFRSGGEVLWWIVGAGAFMTAFSAVTFTGMAGKAYDDGPVVLVWESALGTQPPWLHLGPLAGVNEMRPLPPESIRTIVVATVKPGEPPAAAVSYTVLPAPTP